MILNDLLRLKDNEVRELLKNNKYLKPGAYAVIKETSDIVKIIHCLKKTPKSFFVEFDNKGVEWYSKGLNLLTYSEFIRLKESKYDNPIKLFKGVNKLGEYLKRRLLSIFPEDRFSVNYGNYSTEVKIYFPEIIIKNSLDCEHTIRDLYVTLRINNYIDQRLVYLDNIKLFRATFTPSEAAGYVDGYSERLTYIHSHYNGNVLSQSGSMCFGDTEFGKFVSRMKENFNPKEFIFFILHLENYLKWESIEGVPYRRINSLRKFAVKQTTLANIEDEDSLVEDGYNYIINNINSFNYEFPLLEDGKFTVKLAENSIKDIENILIKYYTESGIDTINLLGRKVDGKFGEVEVINKEYIDKYGLNPTEKLLFNDEYIKSKVIEDPDETSLDEITNLYPLSLREDILNVVVGRIENKFLSFFIKQKLT